MVLDFIYNLSGTLLFILLSVTTTLISILCMSLVYRYIPFRYRQQENAAIISISATISIIYAILAGFVNCHLKSI